MTFPPRSFELPRIHPISQPPHCRIHPSSPTFCVAWPVLCQLSGPVNGGLKLKSTQRQNAARRDGASSPTMAAEPPDNYHTPPFPSLNVKTLFDETDDRRYTLYYLRDIWWYTLLWTLIVFIFFHLSSVLIAMFTHGWTKSSWKYIWIVPASYLIIAGVEAIISGSIVGVMIGAVYRSGFWEMNTWIPCVWGFINVMVLITSSFTVQGGL